MAQGVEVRHRRECRTRTGGRCNCEPSYRAHVFDARANKRIRRTFPTLSAAKLWRQDALVALRRGELAATSTRITAREGLRALVEGMRAGTVLDRSGRRYRPSTIRDYDRDVTKYLVPKLGHLRLSSVRRGDVQKVVDDLAAKDLAGSTVRNKLDPLRVLYRRAIEDELVTQNPTEHLRFPAANRRERRVAAPDRVTALLAALPESERALWATAFYAGLRVSELRALRWRHVEFEAGRINVRRGWDDKEGEQDTKTAAGRRPVPLVGILRAELARHKLAGGGGPDDLCFGRSCNAAFVRSTVRSHALAAWKAAKLEPLTPHEARHTCASYLAAAGLSLKEMQTAMGHADIRTTLNIYAKAVPGWESGAAAKLDKYLEAQAAAREDRAAGP